MYFHSSNKTQTFDITLHVQKESSCRELYAYMAENIFSLVHFKTISSFHVTINLSVILSKHQIFFFL